MTRGIRHRRSSRDTIPRLTSLCPPPMPRGTSSVQPAVRLALSAVRSRPAAHRTTTRSRRAGPTSRSAVPGRVRYPGAPGRVPSGRPGAGPDDRPRATGPIPGMLPPMGLPRPAPPRQKRSRAGILAVGAVAIAVVSAGIGGAAATVVELGTHNAGGNGTRAASRVRLPASRPRTCRRAPSNRSPPRWCPASSCWRPIWVVQSEEGSGIILSADGLILTNNHVVAAAAKPPSRPGRGRGADWSGWSAAKNDSDLLRRPYRNVHGGRRRPHQRYRGDSGAGHVRAHADLDGFVLGSAGRSAGGGDRVTAGFVGHGDHRNHQCDEPAGVHDR